MTAWQATWPDETASLYDDPSVAETLQRNRARFDDVMQRARRALHQGTLDAAAAYLQIAAAHASLQHAGIFASPELEELAARLPPDPTGGSIPDAGCDVLHVLSEAHGIGGHTRLAWNWITADKDHVHSVVLTQQPSSVGIPQKLREAAAASGGSLIRLDGWGETLRRRAAALRHTARNAQFIVLHTHMHDVIPIIAFAEGAPPLIFQNHADHVFWVGVRVADVVANVRETARRLATRRRGVEARSAVILPIPLRRPTRRLSREAAKARLGLPPEATLLLSIATEFKYRPLGTMHFVDVHLPILRAFPNVHLWVVGPREGADWERGLHESRGRLRALGTRLDLQELHEAADIYVDSFPFASFTASLESVAFGTPIVNYTPHPAGESKGDVLRFDDPALDRFGFVREDLSAYAEALADFIERPAHRAAIGEQMAAAVDRIHGESGWRAALSRVYSVAASNHMARTRAGAAKRTQSTSRALEPADSLICALESTASFDAALALAVRRSAGFLPPAERWRALYGAVGIGFHPRMLFSEEQWRVLRSTATTARSAAVRLAREHLRVPGIMPRR